MILILINVHRWRVDKRMYFALRSSVPAAFLDTREYKPFNICLYVLHVILDLTSLSSLLKCFHLQSSVIIFKYFSLPRIMLHNDNCI